jgi:hypothetical protein
VELRRAIPLWLAAAAALAVLAPLPDPLRLIAVGAFLLAAPGLALVGLLRLRDPFAEVVIAVALSLTADLLVAEAFVISGHFWATGAVLMLAALCVCGVGGQLVAAESSAA